VNSTDRRWRWVFVAALAPIAWGASYVVTSHTLPADTPFWGAGIRSLLGGLVLLAIARRLPRGAWWWRSILLGVLNMAAFFALIYLAAQLLPSSIVASVQALNPVLLAATAWIILRERPSVLFGVGAVLGIGGVLAVVGIASGTIDWWGVAAVIGAVVLASVSSVLTKRWADGTPIVAITAWQATIGGLILLPFALALEGPVPPLAPVNLLGYAYLAVCATAIAYWAWLTALTKMPAASVGIVGLLNPVTGVLVGIVAAGESLEALQWLGIVLVFAGILLGQLRIRRRRPENPPAPGSAA
jgi:probable blue pigment (indigoidine) exporter